MRTSEKVGQIAAALAKAQAKMQPPKKDRVAEIKSAKGSYSYHYRDLADLIDSIRGPLSENEIAFIQPLHREDGQLVIETLLIHSSGEWLASDYAISLYDRPQEQGSAITYGRRYSLGTMVGLAPEDDDGAAAQAGEPRRASPPPPPPRERAPVGPVAEIRAIADQIVRLNGGQPGDLIARASAFRAGDDAEQFTAEERWHSDQPFGEGSKHIKDLSGVRSEKWLRKTLSELQERLRVLEAPAEPSDEDLAAEAAAGGENYQASDDDVPF